MTPVVGQVWRLSGSLARRLVRVDAERVEWVVEAAPGSLLAGQPGGTTRAMWSRWVRSARPTLDPPRAPPPVVSDPPATPGPMPPRPDHARLPARALAALRTLVAHAGADGRVGASRAAVERAAGLSTAAYTRALDDLERAGLVARDPQGWRDPLTGAWPTRAVTVTAAGRDRAAVLTADPEVSTVTMVTEHGVSTGEHGSVSTGEHQVQDSFLLPLGEKKKEGRKEEEPCSLSTGEHGVSTAQVSTGEHGAPGDCVLVRLPASWGPAVVARALRALADALDPRPAVAPAAPVVAPPPSPPAKRSKPDPSAKDARGWRGTDCQRDCPADPGHGVMAARQQRATGLWFGACVVCGAIYDPGREQAAREAPEHPAPPPPPEPGVTDRWAEAAARTRRTLGEAHTGAGAVARAVAQADQDDGMTLRERVEAARAAARPVIPQRRPDVRQLVGAG